MNTMTKRIEVLRSINLEQIDYDNDCQLPVSFIFAKKILSNITLKRGVDFHGHVCSELALGSKFCESLHHFLNEKVLEDNPFSVLTENSTAILNAIQNLLGVIIGNQHLMVIDYGKHNYTLYSQHQTQGRNLKNIALKFEDEEAFHALEGKFMNDNALLENIISFQHLLDGRGFIRGTLFIGNRSLPLEVLSA